MPNYNNKEWLHRSIGSIKEQSFKDYGLVFVDDQSTDGSLDLAIDLMRDMPHGLLIYTSKKRWNGGSRNEGLGYFVDSEYTLFLDSDDWFVNSNELHDFIIEHNKPDCVRLPYNCLIKETETPVMLNDDTAEKIVDSCFVACWTKCIKTDLVQIFPENTLMEDVVQHIKQCDVIRSIVPFNKPVVVWNRNNTNSCSRAENQNLQHGKWQSSMYRYMADLLDMELDHDYCKKCRDFRAKVCLDNIKSDKYVQ